jgi:hypothetical protein
VLVILMLHVKPVVTSMMYLHTEFHAPLLNHQP